MFGNYLKEKVREYLQGIVWLYTALVGAPIWYTSGNTILFYNWLVAGSTQMGFLLDYVEAQRLWLHKKESGL